MKKLLVVFGVAALMAVIPLVVLAQTSPDPQSSHVLIQNLAGDEATVVVNAYDSGTEALEATDTFTIAGYGAATVHSTSGTNAPGHRYLDLSSGFVGSMVVSSDNPVVAVNVNAGMSGSSFTNHSAYEGISPEYADGEVFAPSVHWRNDQWSLVGIQNTGSVATTAVYTYYLQDGTEIDSGSATIQPGRSLIRNVYDDIDIGTEPDGVGAMKVSADQDLAVSVIETLYKRTEAYIGFPSTYGDTTIYLPSMHHNFGGQWSHTLLQNMDETDAASVVLTYYQQTGAVADVFVSSVPAKGSLTFHTNGVASSDGTDYEPTHLGDVGSAVITSDQPMVAAVVETLGSGASIQPYAYNGFRSDAGGTTLLFSSVHMNPGGQYSHLLVQNLDTSHTNRVRLEYYKQDGSIDKVYTTTLGAAGSITFHTNNVASGDGKTYSPTSGYGNVGAAKVISIQGRPLVGVNVETLMGIANVYAGYAE
jgi:hypothetical protein